MKRVLIVVVVITGALLFTGCGFTPKVETASVEKSYTYHASYDGTWKAVVAIFAEFNIPIDNIDKDSGYINSRDAVAERSWLNAPEDTLDYYVTDPRGDFNVFIEEIDTDCVVSVTTSFKAYVKRYNIMLGRFEGWENFPSSGVLEKRFHELLADRLGVEAVNVD